MNKIVDVICFESPPTSAIAIGSVADTLVARVDPRLLNLKFKAADYSFGFEAGSPRGFSSVGESVLTNGICYATSTDEHSIDYGKVIWGPEFVTGGMFLLPKEARPSHQLILTGSMKFEHLCETIYESVGRPVAFVGTWESETLYTGTIAKPPIHGLPIFENREYYFPVPHKTLGKTDCFVMGVVTSYSDHRWEVVNKQLETALYKNLFDGNFSLSSHTHCLVLKKETAMDKITPELVEGCLHVFTDKTKLKRARLNLYTLDRVYPFH